MQYNRAVKTKERGILHVEVNLEKGQPFQHRYVSLQANHWNL